MTDTSVRYLHQRTHPDHVPGCFGCNAISVGVAPSATPTRSPEALATKEREARWDKDGAAYKRLRKNGVQPRQIDGSARLEAEAASKYDVEIGGWTNDVKESKLNEAMSEARDLADQPAPTRQV